MPTVTQSQGYIKILFNRHRNSANGPIKHSYVTVFRPSSLLQLLTLALPSFHPQNSHWGISFEWKNGAGVLYIGIIMISIIIHILTLFWIVHVVLITLPTNCHARHSIFAGVRRSPFETVSVTVAVYTSSYNYVGLLILSKPVRPKLDRSYSKLLEQD